MAPFMPRYRPWLRDLTSSATFGRPLGAVPRDSGCPTGSQVVPGCRVSALSISDSGAGSAGVRCSSAGMRPGIGRATRFPRRAMRVWCSWTMPAQTSSFFVVYFMECSPRASTLFRSSLISGRPGARSQNSRCCSRCALDIKRSPAEFHQVHGSLSAMIRRM
jgi:hypothetical protein